MTVKTCVVFLKFKMKGENDYTNVVENSVFGSDCTYATAHDFIQAIKKMHRHSYIMEITNVVIG